MKNILYYPITILTVGIALLISGCVMEYKIHVVNDLDVPVVIEMVQYHSEGYNGTPPRKFTDDLMVKRVSCKLGAKERKTEVFSDATGGFWVRWYKVEPSAETHVHDLELSLDDLTITINNAGE